VLANVNTVAYFGEPGASSRQEKSASRTEAAASIFDAASGVTRPLKCHRIYGGEY
jgi:uncharacterized protein (UPF0333 family)